MHLKLYMTFLTLGVKILPYTPLVDYLVQVIHYLSTLNRLNLWGGADRGSVFKCCDWSDMGPAN